MIRCRNNACWRHASISVRIGRHNVIYCVNRVIGWRRAWSRSGMVGMWIVGVVNLLLIGKSFHYRRSMNRRIATTLRSRRVL